MNYYEKYIKYKKKYLELQNQMGGGAHSNAQARKDLFGEFRIHTDKETVLTLNKVNEQADRASKNKITNDFREKNYLNPKPKNNLAFMSSINIDWNNERYKKLVPNPMCLDKLGKDPKTTGKPLKLRMEGDRKIICIDGITLPCDPSNENGLLVSNIYRVLCKTHTNEGFDTYDKEFYIYIFKVNTEQSIPGYIFYPHKLSDTSGNEILKDDLSDYNKDFYESPDIKVVQKKLREVMENIRVLGRGHHGGLEQRRGLLYTHDGREKVYTGDHYYPLRAVRSELNIISKSKIVYYNSGVYKIYYDIFKMDSENNVKTIIEKLSADSKATSNADQVQMREINAFLNDFPPNIFM